ncbi:beta-1,4 N-acetylgalactosaminyltransferase 1a isoform X1 [Tachysurus fulvidraco]|uniref:beta-1,4 N-acetylgalactosaminyltransferase 1a isoform X1 n=2 Tax=Tachysurus fulvidraco TaxID=1234273 RepID=UPI001FEF449F|nr:beta-1,4 N-acetylgalactosaminyltransferase 1a isoform X1 [Tachysurus fulvidraco]
MKVIMRVQRVKVLMGFVILGLLVIFLIHHWSPNAPTVVDDQRRLNSTITKLLSRNEQLKKGETAVPYQLKEITARNGCVCKGDAWHLNVPFGDLFFPRVGAEELQTSFSAKELEEIKKRRRHEYNNFLLRSHTAANLLIIAEANTPLQYPTQGVDVQPKKSTLIPGLALKMKSQSFYRVNLTASMGTFDVAALVDDVNVSGDGKMQMILSSPLLSALNRQLQFINYTNTIFHPNTADIVQFGTDGYQASFTINIRHELIPKLYDPGPAGPKGEYDISRLVSIATKTFLRYDKLQNLIDSIRQFYPTVTIIIADDNEHPKPVTGPYIEYYTMPFKKGWFAGRNLAISQVTTKYVLWVDDDFIFTSKTRLEKMVDVLESTTLDLCNFVCLFACTQVGGAVREVTGYTATYCHIISTEKGGENGDCLHMRRGSYHVLKGFPNCVVTDAVINFFMARTDKVRQVGFDPRLARVAHLEFFVDGLGVLHVGSCNDVVINHASKIKAMLPWGQTETDKAYSKFRYTNSSDQNALFYFKNHFKCLTSN